MDQYQQQSNPYQQSNLYQQSNSYQQKAPNIFKQFCLAFVPARYERLTKVKIGSMIGFVTLLALVATLISVINQMLTFPFDDMRRMVDRLPDFTITDGHMSLEEDFLYEEDGMYVYMTDEVEGFTYEDAFQKVSEGYVDVILVGRDRIYIMQNRGQLRYQYVGFEMFGRNKQLSKALAVEALMPFLMGLLIILYLMIFVGRILQYFLFAAVYLLFGMVIASIMKKRIEPGALYRTAVYAKVLMFVAAMALELIPFVFLTIPFLIRVPVTLVFMGFAIAKLPGQPNQMQAPMMMGPGGPGGPGGQGWQ